MNPWRRFAFCTLTGIDTDVDLRELQKISERFPFVEWGVLYRGSAEADPTLGNRYPALEWIETFKCFAQRSQIKTSIHLCGAAVREFLERARNPDDGVGITSGFGRIQLNFNHQRDPIDLASLEEAIRGSSAPVITQHNSANAEVEASIRTLNHHVLFDASGGRGLLPQDWPAPLPGMKLCAYAGGLGPENLTVEIRRIEAAARGEGFGVDMESSLRTDDRFDLQKARRCAEIVDQWLSE